MNVFDKIAILCFVYNKKISEIETDLKIKELYKTYKLEEEIVLNDLQKMALYFNVPVSYFFIDGEGLKKELVSLFRILNSRIRMNIGEWQEYYTYYGKNYKDKFVFPPDKDFMHIFTSGDGNDVRIFFLVMGYKKENKFSLEYSFEYIYNKGERCCFPVCGIEKNLYSELLAKFGHESFYEEYCIDLEV